MKVEINDIKIAIADTLHKYGVTRAALFGSIVKGEETKDSDIDILVEFEPGRSLLDLAGLKAELERILNRKVDVVTYRSLHPLLRDQILTEQVVIR
jgi:predicted nucleotidyltransferase